MKRILKWAGVCLAGLAALWMVVATAMAMSPAPKLRYPQKHGAAARSGGAACRESDGIRCFAVRDGARLSLGQGASTLRCRRR